MASRKQRGKAAVLTETAGPERAGISVRVSLDRAAHGLQDEIISPETQEDRARQYCNSQGWSVAAVEHDIDESAYRQHYSKRAGLMRLIEAVKRGEITRIVVWKFSRLSRRLKEFIEICDIVESYGAGVVSVSEQVDTSTSAGRLIRNIMASFAQYQSEELSEQIFETWMTRAKQGRRPGGLAPFGTVNEKGILQPDPETHRHLLAMYTTFRNTGSVRAVWDYLAAQHVEAPVADEWNLNTIRGILTNAVYIGQLDWAGETFQGRWAPLVPVDLWNEVQTIFADRAGSPSGRRDARMLTGMIRCSCCGRPMWTRYAKRSTNGQSHLARVYWCCSPTTNRRGCDIPVVDGDEVDAIVWGVVRQLLDQPGLDRMVASVALRREEGAGTDVARRRQQLIADRERIEAQVRQLYELLHDQDITRDEFRRQNHVYQDRLQTITREMDQVTIPSTGPTPAEVRAAAAMAMAADTDEDRRRVLAAIGARIVVDRERVRLELPAFDLRINLRARRVGETWHLGEQYQALTYQGHTLTDKQERFIQRTYGRADKHKLAERLGRDYGTLILVARRLRRDGVLPPIIKEASKRN